MFTPYLLLDTPRRRQVDKLLEEHAKDIETFEALRTTLEELGDKVSYLEHVIDVLEERGDIRSGLFFSIRDVMGVAPRGDAADWRKIPRRRRKKLR